MRRLIYHFVVVALVAFSVACGANKKSEATSSSAPTTRFCEAMDRLIVLLAPNDESTSPAQTRAAFNETTRWFDQAEAAAPAPIAADITNYVNAFRAYIRYLADAGYDLDVVFSTQQGIDLATATSHTLTPAIVRYATENCGLSFGDEPRPPPST